MINSDWPALDRLVRVVRKTNLLTQTLGVETNCAITTEIRSLREGPPDVAAARGLDLRHTPDIQYRVAILRCGDTAIGEVTAQVAINSNLLTDSARTALRAGQSLGEVLTPLGHRRHTLDIARRVTTVPSDEYAEVLYVSARLDIEGVPIALCQEKLLATVFYVHIPSRLSVSA